MACVYTLEKTFTGDKSLLVSQESLEWNTLENMVLSWKHVFQTIDPAFLAGPFALTT